MPRQARLDAPGALHHIMVRGINKAAIFDDDHDRTEFLNRLGENISVAQATVYAWVLMTNHVHLRFKSGKQGISSVMRKQLTWYAQYYNRRHRRTGHLFENRYKSILCDEDNYLLALIRYIHLNPVRAGLVKTLDELDRYPWNGHSAIMGKTESSWMDITQVLAQFGGRKRAARKAYHTFVSEGLTQGRVAELTGGGLVRSKGGWSQVVSAKGAIRENIKKALISAMDKSKHPQKNDEWFEVRKKECAIVRIKVLRALGYFAESRDIEVLPIIESLAKNDPYYLVPQGKPNEESNRKYDVREEALKVIDELKAKGIK